MNYVIGHKSPDLDSVAAAISYANLKNKLKKTNAYQAALAEKVNMETAYALKKFQFKTPPVLKSGKNKNLILVDHNETAQAVDGTAEAKIMEVLDHHKINFQYNEPIIFKALPWGASCSIIAEEYFQNNIKLNKNMAGLMLAAILIDTVITKSPTSTEKDKMAIKKLSQISGLKDWQKFGLELFKVRASVKKLSGEAIIKSDFKNYDFKSGKFGFGQVETVNLEEFKTKEEAISAGLKKLRETENYHTVILFITDVFREGSKFFISSAEPEKISKIFGQELKDGKVYARGIMSRKKQVVPMFMDVFDK